MAHQPTIVIDTYGGNSAPDAILTAAAKQSLSGKAQLLLVGDAAELQRRLASLSYDPMRLRIVGAPAPYPRHTGDALAATQAARAALPIALDLLTDGEGDVLVTAAPPAVAWELSCDMLKPIAAGVPPALASVVPTLPRSSGDDPFALVLDVSGTPSHESESLVAFAAMGAAYARVVSGVRQPQVSLLSTGLGLDDGPPAVVAAHRVLKKASDFQFVGNMRAVDIPRGYADVVVSDGFTGHAVRGLLEGLTDLTIDAARYAWKSKVTWRAGLRLLSPGVGMLKRVSEFKEYGGSPLLGLEKLVLVANPDSSETALANAIALAGKCARRGLSTEVAKQLDATQELWQGGTS
ncbi:MAG: phosphate acyltransferase PlsX [Myxococcales bacterium]|nr:phosphate acyltransferase PlsX [Myxococcales bacterium]